VEITARDFPRPRKRTRLGQLDFLFGH
jgi:hypothetical protein